MIKKRQEYKTSDIPQDPGVYVYRDEFSQVIYVGKAKNLRKRLSNYFQASRKRTADAKLRSLINSIAFYEFFVVKSESEALLLESRLIKEYAPKYNILMRDDKRFFMIKIDLNSPYPKLQLARIKKSDGATYFGPFPQSSVLSPTVDFLTRYFSLRSCSPYAPNEDDKKHCKDHVIRQCSSPCDATVSPEAYAQQVEALMRVLKGRTSEVIADLKDQMALFAEKMQFEKAAQTRDIIENIRALFNPQRNFANKTLSAEFKKDPVEALQKALNLEHPPKHIECFDNSNFQGTNAVASMVQFIDGRPNTKNYRHFKIKTVEGIDDFASMTEIVYRRYSRLLKEDKDLPDLILIDGGKGQVSSAYSALLDLGLGQIPIYGLAKKQEELFAPGESESTILGRDHDGLRMLMHMRDEAHRFAITFHRKLRQSAIQNSILDDIDGIGKTRKMQILKAFGSIRELKKASAEEIQTKIPGIGIKLAQIIVDYLKK